MAIKQSRGITIGKGTPQRNEGQNGDITVRSLRKGLKMYVKQANVWHSVDLDIDLKQIATTVNNLERKVKELSTKRNNFPVVDKVMLKQAGGAATVQIKNDAGAIAFRNSADSADISLKNPKLTGALDGTDNNPAISTDVSNLIKFVFNDNHSDFFVRLVGQGGAYDNALQFWTGASAKWAMGYTDNSSTTFRINAGANLDADVLQLTSAGNLTVDGTVTSSAGVCSGTTAASTTASGIVELATTAETTTGTDTARAVTPDGLKDGFEGSANIETLGAVATGSWEADAIAEDYIGNLPTSKITSGTMADARIAASNVTQHEGSIDAVGTLDGGAISSGFGNIDNGSSTLDTGALTSASATVTGATLTASSANDNLISATHTLNAGSGENNAMMAEEYSMIKTNLTTTDAAGWDNVYLINQEVGGTSKFKVDNSGNATFAGTVTSSNGVSGRFQVMGQYEVYGRYSSVNTYYLGNQSLGTSVAEGDWGGGFKFNYAQFTAVSDVKLLGWKFIGSFSSTVDWEMEVWHTETDSDGNSDPTEATKVGSTQSVSPTATRIYTLGETGLTYDIPAGDQLYVLVRYTSGSGTKNSYGTVGFEFNNA